MSVFYVLHVFCAGTYLSLAAYVLARNWRARLNWITAAVNLCFALWSSALAVAHYPGISREVAVLAYDVGAVGWGSMASVSSCPGSQSMMIGRGGMLSSGRRHGLRGGAPRRGASGG